MDILQAIIMGVVQGATEFLPISSSAHLVLTPWFFGWKDPGLAFDVALHWGTLVALLLFFWKDWATMAVAWGRSVLRKGGDEQAARLAWFIVLATIPGAVAGGLLESQAESTFRSPWLVGGVMGAFALVMLIAERFGKKTIGLEGITIMAALGIGMGQAFAIVPGVSRAGVTITTGLFFNLRRETAARFSSLLATPIIGGAGLKQGIDLAREGVAADERWPFIIGILAAVVVGYVCIGLLLRFLQARSLAVFVIYRLALATLIFGALLSGLRAV